MPRAHRERRDYARGTITRLQVYASVLQEHRVDPRVDARERRDAFCFVAVREFYSFIATVKTRARVYRVLSFFWNDSRRRVFFAMKISFNIYDRYR